MNPGVVAALGYGAAYAALVRRARRRGGAVSPVRAGAFAAALLAIVVAGAAPLDSAADDGSFAAHALQHELLLDVAPVLALLGLDARLAAPISRVVGRELARNGVAGRAVRALAAPAVGLAVYVAVVVGWHVPGAAAAAADSPAVHAAEHATLFYAGLLFWFHLLRPLPAVQRLSVTGAALYLAVGAFACAIVSAVLIGAPDAVYASGITAGVGDQRLAGAIMMAVQMPIALGVGTAVLMRAAVRGRRAHLGQVWPGT